MADRFPGAPRHADCRAPGRVAADVGRERQHGGYSELAVGRVRDLIAGCGFGVLADIEAGPRGRVGWPSCGGTSRPCTLPAGVQSISPADIAARLGVTTTAVWQTAKRSACRRTAAGGARRYSRAAAEQILARASSGASVQTANYYLGASRAFAGGWFAIEGSRKVRSSTCKAATRRWTAGTIAGNWPSGNCCGCWTRPAAARSCSAA